MSRVNPVSVAAAKGETAQIYKTIQTKLGGVPNIFQALGNSPKVLEAYFTMGAAAANFTPVEKEAIALVVAQENSCGYCLAAHTTIGKKLGLSEDEAVRIRQGQPTDAKLEALAKVTKEIVREKGYTSNSTIDDFYAAGYSPNHLPDLVLVVAQNVFTNYFNHVNGTEVDFPAAKKI